MSYTILIRYKWCYSPVCQAPWWGGSLVDLITTYPTRADIQFNAFQCRLYFMLIGTVGLLSLLQLLFIICTDGSLQMYAWQCWNGIVSCNRLVKNVYNSAHWWLFHYDNIIRRETSCGRMIASGSFSEHSSLKDSVQSLVSSCRWLRSSVPLSLSRRCSHTHLGNMPYILWYIMIYIDLAVGCFCFESTGRRTKFTKVVISTLDLACCWSYTLLTLAILLKGWINLLTKLLCIVKQKQLNLIMISVCFV